jgi:photosystem II stability/assembly factor-like uncharacterized protein
MTEVRKRGWHPDPLGIHHERFYFADDRPGRLVRDDGRTEVYDEVPSGVRVAASIDPRSRGLGAWPELTPTPRAVGDAPTEVTAITKPWLVGPSASAGAISGHDPWPDEPSHRWPRAVALRQAAENRKGLAIGGLVLALALVISLVTLLPGTGPVGSRHALSRSTTTVAVGRTGGGAHSRHRATAPAATVPTSAVPTTAVPNTGVPSWQITAAFPNSALGLNGISCPTPNTCVAVGETTLQTGLVLRSDDGGTTWNQQQPPTLNAPLNAIDCPSVESCFAVGAASVTTTTNGGHTWTTKLLGNDRLSAISCSSVRQCLVVGQGVPSGSGCASGASYATADGGSTWTTSELLCFTPDGIACPTATHCELVGAQQIGANSYGAVFGTVDGGTHWTRQYSNQAGGSLIEAVVCPTATECHAVGNAGINSDLRTTDGGAQWTPMSIPASAWPRYYVAVTCLSALVCQASGNAPPISTQNGGASWSLETMPTEVETMTGLACPSLLRCIGVATSTTAGALTLTLSS